jgi:hypothetical protein
MGTTTLSSGKGGSDVLPRLSCSYRPDCWVAHPKLPSNFSRANAAPMEVPYLHNIRGRELRRRRFFAARPPATSMPPFRKHVPHVVALRSDKQMSRVAALAGVAMMANDSATGDGADKLLPSNAVYAARGIADLDSTVTISGGVSSPYPASGTIDLYAVADSILHRLRDGMPLLEPEPFPTLPPFSRIGVGGRSGRQAASAFAQFHAGSIAHLCRWGGRFGDGNHYSITWQGRK